MRTVLITGAGRNIGRHLAESFAAAGYAAVVNAHSSDAITEVAEGIEGSGGRALAIPADVRDPAQVEEMVEQATATFGGVDVLINCAVVRVTMPIEETSLEHWRLPQDVVLDGAFNCSKAVLGQMRERSWGRIINMAGVSGQRGSMHRIGTVTAKSGLLGFTKALARETASQGITVNAVSPGLIGTERGDHTSVGDPEEVAAHYAKRATEIPVGRMGRLEEVAAACAYLASDEAAYVTGQTLSVNGGLYMP